MKINKSRITNNLIHKNKNKNKKVIVIKVKVKVKENQKGIKFQ